MKRYQLKAEKRTEIGKKLKKLRLEGLVPAAIYGKDVKSLSLQLPLKEFMAVYRHAGQTGLVDVSVGELVLPILIKHVQLHPVSGKVLHVELHKVNLKEKITANVPLETVGESPAEKDGIGILLQNLNEIEVEALPTDLPEKILVDVSGLSQIDQQITVGELPKISGVEIKTAAEEIVIKVAPAVSLEAKKEAEEAAAAQQAASAEVAPPTGEQTPAEPIKEEPAKE